MPNVTDITGHLKLDASDFQKKLGEAEKSGSSFGSRLKSIMGGLATFDLAVGGVERIKGAFDSLIDAAKQQQEITAQTEAVLRSTGGAAGVTAEQVDQLATSLSRTTTFSDDTVQSTENLLLTFTNIGKNIFPDATRATLDMSQALGEDTKSAAIQLGKALNDPVKGVTALQRVGVSFTESQKDLIKSLVESGHQEEAQKLILGELQKEFGGSAEAAGHTLAGQLAILGNQFDQVKEKIGTGLLVALTSLGALVLPKVIDGFDAFADVVGRTAELISKGDWGGIVDEIRDGITRGKNLAGDLASWLAGEVKRIPWGTVWSGVQAAGGGILNLLTGGVHLAAQIGSWLVGQVQSIPWGSIWSGVQAAPGAILNLLTAGANLAADLGSWIAQQVQAIPWGSIWSGVQSAGSAIVDGLKAGANLAIQLGQWIGDEVGQIDWSGVWSHIKGAGEALGSALKGANLGSHLQDAMSGAQGGLSAAQSGLASLGPQIDSALGDKSTVIDRIASAAATLGGVLQSQLKPAWDALVQGFSSGSPLMESLARLWSQLQASATQLQPVLEGVAKVLGGVLVVALGVLESTIAAVVGAFSGALPGAIQVASGLIDTITAQIKTLTDVISGVVTIVSDLLHGQWGQAWADAKSLVTTFISDVGSALGGLAEIATGAISSMAGAAEGALSGFVTTAVGYFSRLVTDSGTNLDQLKTDAVTKVSTLVTDATTEIGKLPGQFISALADLSVKLMTHFAGAFGDALTAVQTGIGNLVTEVGKIPGEIVAAIGDLSGLLKNAGASVIQGLVDGAKGAWSATKGFFGGIAGDIASLKGPLDYDYTILQPAGHQIIRGLVQGSKDEWEQARNFYRTLGPQINDDVAGSFSLLPDLVPPGLDQVPQLAAAGLTSVAGTFGIPAGYVNSDDGTRGAPPWLRPYLNGAADADKSMGDTLTRAGDELRRTGHDAASAAQSTADAAGRVADAIAQLHTGGGGGGGGNAGGGGGGTMQPADIAAMATPAQGVVGGAVGGYFLPFIHDNGQQAAATAVANATPAASPVVNVYIGNEYLGTAVGTDFVAGQHVRATR